LSTSKLKIEEPVDEQPAGRTCMSEDRESPLASPVRTSGDELLTVVVPCLNEAESVTSTVEEILELAPKLPLEVEVLMIDDGSTDETRSRMEALCARHPACRMMVNPRNLGPGRSVMRAYERIEPASWVSVVPGDGEFVFRSIQNLLALRHECDLILGYLQNSVIRSFFRRMASDAFTSVVNLLYGFGFRYLNGMKLYRLEAVRGIEVVSGGHAFNAELLAKATLRNPELRIGEAPFLARGRARGTSKALRPLSVVRAVGETLRGYRSVCRYRAEVIAQEARTPR
jgi:glycosyltransferase involved in cell wall biosynthesis